MDIVSVVAQPKGTNICVPPTSCAINNYRPDPIDATVKNQTVIPSAGLRFLQAALVLRIAHRRLA